MNELAALGLIVVALVTGGTIGYLIGCTEERTDKCTHTYAHLADYRHNDFPNGPVFSQDFKCSKCGKVKHEVV